MDIVTQLNSNIYPNALAKLRVSAKDLSISDVSYELNKGIGDGDSIMAKKSKKTNEDGNISSSIDIASANPQVDLIWKNLGLGKIDLSYACIGYTYSGSMVLLHDDLVSLLINYGFNIEVVLAFIEDFAKHAENDPSAPVVIYSKNNAFIMSDIEPITGK